MKLLFDLFPVILFFIAYKSVGMYTAIAVAMLTISIQCLILYVTHKKLEPMNKLTLILILVLGGASLFFHNEAFFKWKPTAINWGFALAFLGSHFFGKKPLLRHMMDGDIELPDLIWKRLSYCWIAFFTLMGLANVYVIYHYSTDTWVNFKLFGVLGMTLLFAVFQAIYLSRHIDFNKLEARPSHKSI